MSFFGMFGGGSNDDECECNKGLKDHLKKCAGLGKRPPLQTCCPDNDDPCASTDLGGPPTCQGCTPAPKCCPVTTRKVPKIFVPKCDVPPTATFKCPFSCCDPPREKPACCPPPNPCCPPPKPTGCGCRGGGSKGSSDEETCKSRPLKMD